MIVLRALATMGPLHAYSLASRLEQVADHSLSLNQGTLYPALVRLEQRGWIKGGLAEDREQPRREVLHHHQSRRPRSRHTDRALASPGGSREQAPRRRVAVIAALRRWLARLLDAALPGRAEADLSRENRRPSGNARGGVPPSWHGPGDARAAARRAFSGVEQVKDRHRDVRSFVWLRDVRGISATRSVC
jgi:hypothetical protein